MAATITADDRTFAATVLAADTPVVVDFWATWCGPCRSLAPLLEQLAADRDDIAVVKVDVDQAPDVTRAHQLMSVPTVVIYRDGQPTSRLAGQITRAQIEQALDA